MSLPRLGSSIVVSALLMLPTSPLFAEQRPWNGLIIEESEIPEETTPTAMHSLDQADIARPATYGSKTLTAYNLGPCDAFIRDDTHTSNAPNCLYITPADSQDSTAIGFPVHLPAGASIEYVDMHFYDTDEVYNPSAGLYYVQAGSLHPIFGLTPPDFSGGENVVRFGPISHTVENSGVRTYNILAVLEKGAGDNRILGFSVWYRLQISPSPSVSTFSDVPTDHFFFQHIEALASSGITTGYQDGTYRPDDYVTRAQIAAFLARALGLHFPDSSD